MADTLGADNVCRQVALVRALPERFTFYRLFLGRLAERYRDPAILIFIFDVAGHIFGGGVLRLLKEAGRFDAVLEMLYNKHYTAFLSIRFLLNEGEALDYAKFSSILEYCAGCKSIIVSCQA